MSLFSFLNKAGNKPARVDLKQRFQMQATAGPGSMSKVWRATDNETGERYAIKILDKVKTAKLEERYQTVNKPSEAEISLQLDHPNIVKSYEAGFTLEDEPYLLMELIDGVSLSNLVELQNTRIKKQALSFMIQLGQSLVYLHEQGFMHHDLCPRNVMVTVDNRVKLIDFGLAVPNTPDFQKPGNRTGTAQYMAPELIKRQRIDQRIDVFAYALTCYEIVTGKLPWNAGDSFESVLKCINAPPTDIREYSPKLDAQLAEAIMKGAAPNPDDRAQTISEMVDQFVQIYRRLKARKRSQS
ncbi:Serine/threonine-protein kinase PknB [Polystyrenella longa]|uniref:Serine/threonine-protein kinase PknB n=1 Tax=Polystyrenella longa TaxID=2528007 RepID=A0A518CQI8_9PLAN|nr:serine/threonine-protein kinase [Polystyrenella longa]QDU81497.1 Serine/threonine-protein kinase PknB [Polystyrenella longa]